MYDMSPTPVEPRIRLVVACDQYDKVNAKYLTNIKKLQDKGFDILILNKKRDKLKIVLYVGLEAKQETEKYLTNNEIVDWIYKVAEGKPIPATKDSPFRLCTEDCPEGTCEPVQKEIEEEQFVPQKRRRFFR